MFGATLLVPGAARAQLTYEGRCWVAIRTTGPEAVRVSEEEAEQRLRIRCRCGDAIVYRTDAGQPVSALAARYCDMARPIMVERVIEMRPPEPGQPPGEVTTVFATCTYRGAPRMDR
ncbi:hypothetical protein [Neoroseomonas lacus]|uniref:Uncharacterized protein n=1 Tax=Neoroseomonas lacus TaxID=287609 RepID=A0A917KW12_9PROT|nr:hypothetical protein [Neoroseomonas lacus]GGJ32686.1 hypothetical protein GCM10011320_45400 [Neoroseomonas lacus]